MTLRSRLRNLYEGTSEAGDRFRYALLGFDILTVAYLIATSFLPRGLHTVAIDVSIGLVFLVDVLARLWISRRPLKDLFSLWGVADVLAVVSLLLPFWGEGLAFLRVLRLYRVFHSEQTIHQLREDISGFRRNEMTFRAAANLLIFIFAMTALVYQTQSGLNDKIGNYADALYFTVTTLSTVGFGDVHAIGQAARFVVILQVIVDFTLLAVAVKLVVNVTKDRLSAGPRLMED